MMLENETRVTEFILLGFGDLSGFQIPLFLAFLVLYILTIAGNILIFLLVIVDQHLHIPMYFFLANLSFLDACYTSNVLPRVIWALLTGNKQISFSSCFTQWYFCASLIVTECCLFCAMSYDRYLAVCKPLHYVTMMKTQTCAKLAATSWINGFVVFLIILLLLLQLPFCGPNEIDHYFCDYFPLLKLSCSDISLMKMISYILAVVFVLCPFLLILTSYIYIVMAIMRIPSTTGRQKAFSTCSSHLIVASIFYGSLMIEYMLPKGELQRGMQKFSSLSYIVLPPLVNPFIYSLRNKEVKEALRNMIWKIVHYKLHPIKLVNGIHLK